MAAVPVAQPYWKQAMPAAYSPDAFKSLSPEEQLKEKKKAGCCASFCCCLLIIIIVLVVSGGAAAALVLGCANPKTCPYELAKGPNPKVSTPKDFTSDLTKVAVTVTRGKIDVSAGTGTGSSAKVTSNTYDKNLKENEYIKNAFAEDGDEWVSMYEKSNTGTNDCIYCRTSDVALEVGTAVTEVDLTNDYGPITSTGSISVSNLNIASTSGDLTIGGSLESTGDLRVATDIGTLKIDSTVNGANVQLFGGAGVLGTKLQHVITGAVSGANVTISGNANSVTTVTAALAGDESWVDAPLGSTVHLIGGVTAGDFNLAGRGTVHIKGPASASNSIEIDAQESADFTFDNIDGADVDATLSVSADVKMTYTCPANTKLDFEVKYYEKSGLATYGALDYLQGGITQNFTLTNQTVTTGGIAYTEFTGTFTGCSAGGASAKRLTVDLTLAVGATFEVIEA